MSAQLVSSPRGPASSEAGLDISAYDRVVGWLVALTTVLGVAVACLALIWLARFRNDPPVLAPTTFAGRPDGDPSALEPPLGADGEVAGDQVASSDPAASSVDDLLERIAAQPAADWAVVEDAGDGSGSGGRGGGGVGDGTPLGETGPLVNRPRAQALRWALEFNEGGGLDEYARQLDFFGVELGVVGSDGRVDYATGLSRSRPTTRSAPTAGERRMWFSWRTASRRTADSTLLARAGILAANRNVLHFYPDEFCAELARLEAEYLERVNPGRELKEVFRTTYRLRRRAEGYEFFVSDQKLF